MNFLILSTLVGLTSAVSALPTSDRAVGRDEAVECYGKSPLSSHRELIHKAGVMGDDDRGLLRVNAPKLGISDDEVANIYRCRGVIACPNPEDRSQPFVVGAGSVCVKGEKCRADKVTTAGHMFVDQRTNAYAPEIEKCEFFSYQGHRSKLELADIRKAIDPKIPTLNPYQHIYADPVQIRLKKPIPGCQPHEVASREDLPAEDETVTAITHIHRDHMKLRVYDGREPLGYPCIVKEVEPGEGNRPDYFKTACDAKGRASGGVLVKRGKSGKLVIVGILVSSYDRDDERDGTPYDPIYNHTEVVGLNGPLFQPTSSKRKTAGPRVTERRRPRMQPTTK